MKPPRKPRHLFPVRIEAEPHVSERADEQRALDVYKNLQTVYKAGQAIREALRQYPKGDKIPLFGRAKTCGAKVLGRADFITYSQFVELVDALAADVEEVVVSLDKELQDFVSWEQLGEKLDKVSAKVTETKTGWLVEAILAGFGLVTLWLESKLVNLFNSPGNAQLYPPSASAWFGADSLVGLALFIILSGDFGQLDFLAKLEPGLKVKIDQVKADPEKIVRDAGIDVEEIKSALSKDSRKCLYDYVLEYIDSSDDPSAYVHWTSYAAVVTTQYKLLSVLEQCKGSLQNIDDEFSIDSPHRPKTRMSSFYTLFLQYYHAQVAGIYKWVLDLFDWDSGGNIFLDPCCIMAAVGAETVEQFQDTFDTLSKLAYVASLAYKQQHAIIINWLRGLYFCWADRILFKLFDKMDELIFYFRRKVDDLFFNVLLDKLPSKAGGQKHRIAEIISKCFDIPGLEGMLFQAFSGLEQALIDLAFCIRDRLAPKYEAFDFTANRANLLRLARLFRYIAHELSFAMESCVSETMQAKEETIRKWLDYPQLKVEGWVRDCL